MSEHDPRTFYSYDSGVIWLPVGNIKGLPRNLRHENEVFQRVPELRVTLCALKQTTGRNRPSAHFSTVLRTISRQLALNSVTFGGFTPPLSLCENEDGKAKSIITSAEVLGLSEWVQCVRSEAGLSLAMPSPHVTLYTRGDARGVAVESLADRTLLCEQVELPNIQAVLYGNN